MSLEVDVEVVRNCPLRSWQASQEQNRDTERSLTSESQGRRRTRRSRIIPAKDLRMVSFAGANCPNLLRIIILMLVPLKEPSVCSMTMLYELLL
ncbi:hypothetical protein Hamer_G032187, partial [Homarus americanus]